MRTRFRASSGCSSSRSPCEPPATFRKLDRILRRLGFEPRRGKGSHVVYRHPDGRTATLADHGGREIGAEIIQDILKDVGLSRDDYLAMR